MIGPTQINLSEGFVPLPKQEEFMRSKARFRCLVGGVGSGKTLPGCYEALKQSFKYKFNFGLIGAQTYPLLRDTTMRQFLEICSDIDARTKERNPKAPSIIRAHNKSEDRITFINGSEIIFRALDDANKFKSLNLGFFYIDEMSEVDEEVFLMLQSRLRLKHLRDVPHGYRGFGTTNPEGHNWVWRKFVQNNKNKAEYALIVSPTKDNIHLPPGYIDSLMASYPKDWQKKYLEGSFDVFEGMIYKDFDADVHVIPYKTPPATWPRFVGIDFGVQNPTAVLYVAEDKDGNLYVYDEIYKGYDNVPELARDIKRKELGDEDIIAYRVGDTSAGSKEMTSGESIRDQLADPFGIEFENPDKDIIAGVAKVAQYLKAKKLYVMSNCVNTIEEFKLYRWEKSRMGKELNMREKPLSWKNHAMDALRYLIMSRPDLFEMDDGPPRVKSANDLMWDRVKRLTQKVDAQEDSDSYWEDPLDYDD